MQRTSYLSPSASASPSVPATEARRLAVGPLFCVFFPFHPSWPGAHVMVQSNSDSTPPLTHVHSGTVTGRKGRVISGVPLARVLFG